MAGGEDQKQPVEQGKSSNAPRIPEPWEASNHPLYLHHSDQPGAVLVSQPLVEDNYTTWVQSMSMALMIKNKKGFVDGSLRRPTTQGDEQMQWDRCNTLVKTWLLGSLSKEISNSVIHCKDARGMWLELQERFSHVNTVQSIPDQLQTMNIIDHTKINYICCPVLWYTSCPRNTMWE